MLRLISLLAISFNPGWAFGHLRGRTTLADALFNNGSKIHQTRWRNPAWQHVKGNRTILLWKRGYKSGYIVNLRTIKRWTTKILFERAKESHRRKTVRRNSKRLRAGFVRLDSAKKSACGAPRSTTGRWFLLRKKRWKKLHFQYISIYDSLT